MHKTLWFLIAGILLMAPASGLTADAPSGGPEAFLPESIFEFEPVLEGTPVTHAFILYNRGEAPLKILKVRSG